MAEGRCLVRRWLCCRPRTCRPGTCYAERAASDTRRDRTELAGRSPTGRILAKPARRKTWLRALDQAVASAGAEGAVVVYLGAPRGDRREEWLLLVRGSEVLIEQRTVTGDETSEQRVSRWRALLESSLGVAAVGKAEAPVQSDDAVTKSEAPPPSEKNPYRGPSAGQKRAIPPPATPEHDAARVADQGAAPPPSPRKKVVVATAGPAWAARFFRHSEPTTAATAAIQRARLAAWFLAWSCTRLLPVASVSGETSLSRVNMRPRFCCSHRLRMGRPLQHTGIATEGDCTFAFR